MSKWLDEIIEWYGEPGSKVENLKMDDAIVWSYVWFPEFAKTNHNIHIAKRSGYSGPGVFNWCIRVNRHALRNEFAHSRVEYIYIGAEPPSDELMRGLLTIVGYRDYRIGLDKFHPEILRSQTFR